LEAQFKFQEEVVSKLTETNKTIKTIRKVKAQVKDIMSKTDVDTIQVSGKKIIADMTAIEEALYQTKNRSGQDPLNYPIRLNNKLGHLNSLMGMGDNAPTESAVAFKKEVTAEIDKYLQEMKAILSKTVPNFNELVKSNQVNAIQLD
jgi:hypothetical protein